MRTATQLHTLIPKHLNRDKLRLHGLTIGLVLFAASILVASSVTAVINVFLIAIPIFALIALVGLIAGGIPLVFAGIHAHKMAQNTAAGTHDSAMLLSLEGFWKHSPAWNNGRHPHFVGFQRLDHDVLIHLDSKSEDNPVVMQELVQRGGQGQDVDKSLEGLRDYRLV